MTGRIETFSDGREVFIPLQCEYCELTTGGEHAFNCPNNPETYKIKIKSYKVNNADSISVSN